MKKLLVLSLTVVMVLAFAVASYAATVTMGGELNFGKKWCDKSAADTGNVSDAKLTATAQIADDIKAFVAFKAGTNGGNVVSDEAWTQFTEDYGTIKVGYFGYNQNQKDLVSVVIPDVKSGLTASFAAKLTDQLTLNIAAANDATPFVQSLPGLDYSVGLGFAADNFGGSINYFKYTASESASAYSLMGYYQMDALKLYAQYDKMNVAVNAVAAADNYNFLVGGVYDSADVPFFVRAEYDFNKQGYTSNNWAIRLAYKMNSNVKIQYQIQNDNTLNAGNGAVKNELKLVTTF